MFPGSPTYPKINKPAPALKRVKQLDMEGNLIKVWDSVTEAANSLHIRAGNVWKTASGDQKSSGGFKWEYVKDGEFEAGDGENDVPHA